MLDAIAFLAAHAHPRVTLWVLRGNARAIAFYEGFGFRLDGATKIEGALEELRMVRELSR